MSSGSPSRPSLPSVSEVETARLRLRRWRAADLPEYGRIIGDPEVMRYIGVGWRYRLKRAAAAALRRVSNVEARRGIAALEAHWDKWGYGEWAVEEKESGALIGQIGLVRHDDFAAEPGQVEIGWMLARSAWGRGFATEAAQACVDHAFERLRLERLISIGRPANTRTERVMLRLGLALVGRTYWRGGEVVWYAIDRATWLSRRAEGRREP